MSTATSITVRVPLKVRRRPGRKTVVTPMADGVAPVTTRADPVLVKALARAFRYQRMLDDRRYASVTEMAAAEKIERGYLGSLLRLTLLAPDLVEAILDGRQPEGLAFAVLDGGCRWDGTPSAALCARTAVGLDPPEGSPARRQGWRISGPYERKRAKLFLAPPLAKVTLHKDASTQPPKPPRAI
jgi:hypothetical protein